MQQGNGDFCCKSLLYQWVCSCELPAVFGHCPIHVPTSPRNILGSAQVGGAWLGFGAESVAVTTSTSCTCGCAQELFIHLPLIPGIPLWHLWLRVSQVSPCVCRDMDQSSLAGTSNPFGFSSLCSLNSLLSIHSEVYLKYSSLRVEGRGSPQGLRCGAKRRGKNALLCLLSRALSLKIHHQNHLWLCWNTFISGVTGKGGGENSNLDVKMK